MVDLCTATPIKVADESDGLIHVPNGRNPPVLTTANTEAATWTAVKVEWHGPEGDLILIIETPFTERQEPFIVALREVYDLRFLQIIDGEEIKLTANNHEIQMESDSNYQVVLKASAKGHSFMTSFRYVASAQ